MFIENIIFWSFCLFIFLCWKAVISPYLRTMYLWLFSYNKKNDNYSPREIRHLAYISQYPTDIRYISENVNIVADARSRLSSIQNNEFNCISQEQLMDMTMKQIPENISLTFR